MTDEDTVNSGPGSCTAAVLTPAGRGAIASVVVAGVGARSLVSCLFRPNSGQPLARYEERRIVLGEWRAPTASTPGEQLVVQAAGENYVEIHCHGGRAAVTQVLQSLGDSGCRVVDPVVWLDATQPDRLVAEAHETLTKARTMRTAGILLDQMQGALSRTILTVLSLIAEGKRTAAIAELETLLDAAQLGIHLVQPWRVIVAGHTNAGKSTLVNALLGYARSIVDSEPGTTRDVLSADMAVDGWPVEIMDTAGLNIPADELEQAGIRQAERQFTSADLLVWLADSTRPWDGADSDRLTESRRPVLVVHNKSDLASRVPGSYPAGIEISARLGDGIPRLLEAIATQLVPHPPAAGAAGPFRPRHVTLLERVRQHLRHKEAEAASTLLRQLTTGSESA